MLTASQKVLQQLAALLLERAGLKITPDGFHSLRLALSARMPVLGLDEPEHYIQRLTGPGGEEELRSLLPLVTVGHTEFFRDGKQFRALEKSVLPELVSRSRREMRKVSIWSAGCATGEEPYSLAMVLAELGALSLEVDLWATDLNLAAVEAAKQGRFTSRRAISINQERLTRFFKPAEEGYEALPALREYIRFDGQNLAVPVFDKVALSSLDLILCRNVIIYFDLPTIRGLMDRFLAALRPGGLLFLGYSESLFKVYDRFEMIEVEGAFVYRRPLNDKSMRAPPLRITPYPGEPDISERKPADAFTADLRKRMQASDVPLTTRLPAVSSSSVASPSVTLPAVGASTSPRSVVPGRLPAVSPHSPLPAIAARSRVTAELPTVGSVDSSRPRITTELPALATTPRSPTVEVPAWPTLLPPAERLAMAVRKMAQGDFSAAIAGVQRLLADEPSDLDGLLTLGNLFSLTGRIPEAREAFAQAIQREPLCVEARVFGGVAALQAGELSEARSELGKALFLEPTLAIGHYLMAQVHERTQDHEAARRSYRNAIAQLRFSQRPLAGHYPEMPDSADAISRAARYALAALEEQPLR